MQPPRFYVFQKKKVREDTFVFRSCLKHIQYSPNVYFPWGVGGEMGSPPQAPPKTKKPPKKTMYFWKKTQKNPKKTPNKNPKKNPKKTKSTMYFYPKKPKSRLGFFDSSGQTEIPQHTYYLRFSNIQLPLDLSCGK